tara:strand:- start:19 stop:183 length:165 start_codon:yes stop_codon:yes gene_type:complete
MGHTKYIWAGIGHELSFTATQKSFDKTKHKMDPIALNLVDDQGCTFALYERYFG